MIDTEQAPKIIGRYAICSEIAAGGMATVYFGRLLGPAGFARTVAIKRLHPQYAKDAEFVSMFLDEARMAARIRHPNVVQTLDIVQLKGELFLVMDYVPGESVSRLNRLLRQQGRLTPRRIAAAIISGALLGLHAAHEAKDENGVPLGLVHRDVSPQNVMVGTDGVARILDFGIAKAAGRAHTTRDGSMKGKCAYMAPEQVLTRDVTRSTDVFAAGVVLWELLTGQRLFQADTDGATLMKVMQSPIPAPSTVVRGIPPSWDAVVLKATRRVPAERFATARDMAIAIEACEGAASTTHVGEWVESLAASTLSTRAQLLAHIEKTTLDPQDLISDHPPAPSNRAPAVPSSEHTSVEATLSKSTADAKSRWPLRTPAWIALIAVAVATPLAIAIAWSLRPSEHAASAPSVAEPHSSGATLPATAQPLEKPVAPVVDGDNGPANAAPVVSAEALPSAPSSAAIARPIPYVRPTSTVTVPSTPARTGGSPADCDPPYTLDASGHRHYKRQCLQ